VILEAEYLIDRIDEVLRTAFVDAALQDPDADEPIVTTVVPSWADGDVVFLEGAFSIDAIARAIVTQLDLRAPVSS
jgi:hypothetical protein